VYRVAVLAVIYYEPFWINTARCLAEQPFECFFADRQGVNGLPGAINAAFDRYDLASRYDFVWVVTDVQFKPHVPTGLAATLYEDPTVAAVGPVFASDYVFCQPNPERPTRYQVPFVEFKAVMLRASVLRQIKLDAGLPYWGYDADWGYRVGQEGWKILVDQRYSIDHVYMRHLPKGNATTELRWQRMVEATDATLQRLVQKYGPNWRKRLYTNT
jgi:GT2 family glycosyltransferase